MQCADRHQLTRRPRLAQECNKCCAAHPTRPWKPPSKTDDRLNAAVGLDSHRGMGTARPGEKRTGGGGGFREIDDEEAQRRKRRADAPRLLRARRVDPLPDGRRAEDEARQTEARKEQKIKCQYCKRCAAQPPSFARLAMA